MKTPNKKGFSLLISIALALIPSWAAAATYTVGELRQYAGSDCWTVSVGGTDRNVLDILEDASLGAMTKFAYCSCSKRFNESSDHLKDEKDVMDEDDQKWPECVSDTETALIIEKSSLLKEAKRSTWSGNVFSSKGKTLSFDEMKQVSANLSGLDCGGLLNAGTDNDVMMCMKDARRLEFQIKKDQGYLSKAVGSPKLILHEAINYLIAWTDYFMGFLGFGFRTFDQLPELAYKASDTFDRSTLIGWINTGALAFIAFFIVFFLMKKTVGREESYGAFLTKFGVVLAFTIGWAAIYGSIRELNDGMSETIASSLAASGVQGVTAKDISMDTFGSGEVRYFTSWSIIFGFFNMLLLLALSLVVYARNLFLYGIGYVIFALSSLMLVGSHRRDDVFTATDIMGKAYAKATEWFAWSLGAYASVLVSIFLFKLGTIVFSSVPAPEGNGMSILENIHSLGISTFIYLSFLAYVIYLWKKQIHPAVSGFIDNCVSRVFMKNGGTISWRDFVGSAARSFKAIKTGYEREGASNPFLIKADQTISRVGETMARHVADSSLLGKRSLVHKATMAGVEAMRSDGAINRVVRTAVAAGTWFGEAWALTKKSFSAFWRKIYKGETERQAEKIEGKISEIKATEWFAADSVAKRQVRSLERERTELLESDKNKKAVIDGKAKIAKGEAMVQFTTDAMKEKSFRKQLTQDQRDVVGSMELTGIANQIGGLSQIIAVDAKKDGVKMAKVADQTEALLERAEEWSDEAVVLKAKLEATRKKLEENELKVKAEEATAKAMFDEKVAERQAMIEAEQRIQEEINRLRKEEFDFEEAKAEALTKHMRIIPATPELKQAKEEAKAEAELNVKKLASIRERIKFLDDPTNAMHEAVVKQAERMAREKASAKTQAETTNTAVMPSNVPFVPDGVALDRGTV